MNPEQQKYIARNFARAIIWLLLIIGIYLILKNYSKPDYLHHLKGLFENRLLMIAIFTLSELIFGIIPPEVFMIWALQTGALPDYLAIISLLAVLSYAAGIVAFTAGTYLNKSKYFRFLKRKYLKRLDGQLKSFGIYLILIAATTPVPFSGVCMLIGATRFSIRIFLFFALSRFIRFYVYAYVFWSINTPNLLH